MHLGGIWRHLEASGGIWKHLGGIWEASGFWRHLEASGGIWRHLGGIWEVSGGIWRHLEASGDIWKALGGPREHFAAPWEPWPVQDVTFVYLLAHSGPFVNPEWKVNQNNADAM